MILTSITFKEDLKIRAVEFFFNSSNNNSCEFITTQLFVLNENLSQDLNELSSQIYYTFNPETVKNNIFNLESYNLELKKNKTYFIGLFFEPSENCDDFLFQGISSKNKKEKTIANPLKEDFSNALTHSGFGLKYRIYYK